MGDLFCVENLFRDEQKKVKKRKKSGKATLSFALDDEGEGEGGADTTSGSATPNASANAEDQRKKFRKNPAVDTSFLPDRDREEAERRQREELRQQWLKRQEEMKKEEIEITYSYWDGSGHRKSVVVSLPFFSCVPLFTLPTVQER
jgi:protein FAM50